MDLAVWDGRLITGSLQEGTTTQELFRELVPNSAHGGQWLPLALPDAPANGPSSLLPLSDNTLAIISTSPEGFVWGELEGTW